MKSALKKRASTDWRSDSSWSERSRVQCLCQRVFYGCLVLVGCTTVAALLLGSGYWASCGATLAIMAVGVTFDLGRAGSEALI